MALVYPGPFFVGKGVNMRALQTHDVFKAVKIVNALGVRDEVKKIALSLEGKKKINEREIGVEFILNILGSAGDEKVENLIYDLLGGILEIEPEEIRVMDPLKLVENIKALSAVIDVENWKSFFHYVASMMN